MRYKIVSGELELEPIKEKPDPLALKWDVRLTQFGVSYNRNDLDKPWLLAAWITIDGQIITAPEWAREYMNFAEAGADHHALGKIIDTEGHTVRGLGLELSWKEGYVQPTMKASGWYNVPLYSSYDPSTGSGGYTWGPVGGQVLRNLGLPLKRHISTFGVWLEPRGA